jgi:hypothetical protein
MPKKENIVPHEYKKGQSGNPNGRPKKVFSVIIAEMKERGIEPATPSNVADIYQYLLALPLSEIIKIAGSPKEENGLPAIMRIAAKELIGKRGLEIMKEMLDRANGKPKSSVELSNPDGTMKQTIIFSDGTTRDERGNIVEKADH